MKKIQIAKKIQKIIEPCSDIIIEKWRKTLLPQKNYIINSQKEIQN